MDFVDQICRKIKALTFNGAVYSALKDLEQTEDPLKHAFMDYCVRNKVRFETPLDVDHFCSFIYKSASREQDERGGLAIFGNFYPLKLNTSHEFFSMSIADQGKFCKALFTACEFYQYRFNPDFILPMRLIDVENIIKSIPLDCPTRDMEGSVYLFCFYTGIPMDFALRCLLTGLTVEPFLSVKEDLGRQGKIFL